MLKGMLGEVKLSPAWETITEIVTQIAGKDGELVHRNLKLLASRRIGNWDEAKPPQKERKRSLTLDTFVSVDRSERPPYPSWVTGVLYPELEKVGPRKYRPNKVRPWLHPDQESGSTTGNVTHEYLRDNDMLKDCLGLADAIEIQKKGIEVYRKFFGGKVVYFWKSVVRDSDGNLRVPYLYEGGDEVMLDWDWLDYSWSSRGPAARFAS